MGFVLALKTKTQGVALGCDRIAPSGRKTKGRKAFGQISVSLECCLAQITFNRFDCFACTTA